MPLQRANPFEYLPPSSSSESEEESGSVEEELSSEEEQEPESCLSSSKKRGFNAIDNVEEFVTKEGLDFLSDEKRAEMEEKWKKLQLEELKLFSRKRGLLKQQSGMIMAPFED